VKAALVGALLALGLVSAGCHSTSDADRALVLREVSDARFVVKADRSPEDQAAIDAVFDMVVADVDSAILGASLRPTLVAIHETRPPIVTVPK